MGAVADQAVMLIIGILLILAGVVPLLWPVVSPTGKKASGRRRVMSFVSGVVLLFCGAALTLDFFNQEKQAPFEASLIEQAHELNKTLPRMLDKNTRFEDVTVYGREVYYRHTVVNSSADQVDQVAFQKIMYLKLTRRQCSNQELIPMLKRGVSYRYNYFGNKGALISTVVISREACGVR